MWYLINEFLYSRPSSDGPWVKWFGGIVVPTMILVGAALGIIYNVDLLAGGGRYPGGAGLPSGSAGHSKAIGSSAILVGIAGVVHAHYFWGTVYHLARWSPIAKVSSIAIVPIVILLGFLID